jgi:folate-dependent phosphoribosylglycinamide formyltransferase PurN
MKLRVFVLSNDDLTSNLVFAPLFASEAIDVVGLAFTSTLLGRRRGGAFAHTLLLLRRTDRRYWAFQVFVNGALKLRDLLPGKRATIPSLRRLCAEHGIEASSSANFSAPDFVDVLRHAKPDLIVIRINQLLSSDVLELASHGVWCVHSSILPAYGGIAAELQGLANGEHEVGTTIFRVTEELDAGVLLVQHALSLAADASLFSAIVANNEAAGALLKSTIEALAAAGTIERDLVNPPHSPSYYSWPTRADVRRLHTQSRKIMRVGEAARYLRALVR